MQLKHKALTGPEMKEEILQFLETRAKQERAKMVTTNRRSAKSLYIGRAHFIEELIEELRAID